MQLAACFAINTRSASSKIPAVIMDVASSTQAMVPQPSGTADPTSHSGPNLAWLAAPVVLFALLLALSCCVVVCIVVRQLNHKNTRIRPQMTNPRFFDASFDAEVDGHKLPGNTAVDTRVKSHIEVELGHPFPQQNGICNKNDQTTNEDCTRHCGEANQEEISSVETIARQLKMQDSLEDSAISEGDHGSYTQCTKSPPLHAQDPPSLVDSGLHLQECGDGTECESDLPWPAGSGTCSKQPALSQDGPEGGNGEWTYEVVQDMAALSQYTSQGDHDVFVFREESRMPLLVRLPPLPPIEEYHIGGGQQKHGFPSACHAQEVL